jgi:hypothetical protein
MTRISYAKVPKGTEADIYIYIYIIYNIYIYIWNLLISFGKGPGQPQPVARHLTAPTDVLKSVAHGSWRPGADPRRFRLAVTRAGLSAEMGDARHTKKTFVTDIPWGLVRASLLHNIGEKHRKASQKLMFAALGFTPLCRNAMFI